MRIRCECGQDFTTEDHDRPMDFGEVAVVGPLGPDTVRNQVALSEAHVCPHCGQGRYFVVALQITHLTPDERQEFERFMLRYYRKSTRRT